MLACAYASHGDTKHVLLFPEDPDECFEMSAQALDLADRLQTPVFVMTDLDIGMNQRLCRPFKWDDSREIRPRQGDDPRRSRRRQGLRSLPRRRRRRHSLPHLSGHASDQGRLLHARHHARTPTPATRKPAPITSTTCSGCAKFETAKALVPLAGVARKAAKDALSARSSTARPARRCRRRSTRSPSRASTSTPCACAPSRSRTSVADFIAAHDKVFVVEQNRDAQLRRCWSTRPASIRRS
jgi:2-oxoglutarate ferredoxin oxidoreductase subunit alpha